MESSQTPKPPKISLWRNVLYAWKKLKAVEGPAYFLILGLSLICQVAAPLIGLILPSTIVRLYQANTPWQQMVWSIFLMSFALLLLQLGKVYCQRKTETIPFFLRLDLVPEFLLRSVCRDYQLAESPAGQDGMASAQRAILMGNQFGIEAFLVSVGTAMYQLCGFVVYVFISAQLNVWILAVLLATTAGIALLNHEKQKAGHTYVEDIVPPENRLRRLAGQILDGKYAKDIHLYQMKTWLMGTIDGIRGLTLSIDNRYARKVFLLFLGQQFLILVRDGFVYGYLLYQMVHGAMAAADFILFSGVAAGISTWLSGFAGQLSEMQSNGDLVSHYRLYMDELPSKGKPRDFQGAPGPQPRESPHLTDGACVFPISGHPGVRIGRHQFDAASRRKAGFGGSQRRGKVHFGQAFVRPVSPDERAYPAGRRRHFDHSAGIVFPRIFCGFPGRICFCLPTVFQRGLSDPGENSAGPPGRKSGASRPDTNHIRFSQRGRDQSFCEFWTRMAQSCPAGKCKS